jgi:hypothetical protein
MTATERTRNCFIDAYLRIRNDGPQRSFSYGWCAMDVGSGEPVRPSLRTPRRGLVVPVDESEEYGAGAEMWRTLTFEYPVGRLPHFLTCGRARFDVPSSPPN